MFNKIDPKILVDLYRKMDEETRQEEIDAIFEIVWAMLEATECDSIESYPNTNIKLKFSCEVLQDQSKMIN
jgi:hypothetical protein